MEEAYGGEDSKPLFDGLWLGTAGKWDFAKNNFAVIHLDMSSVAGPDNNQDRFKASLIRHLKSIARKFEITLPKNPDPKAYFIDLIELVSEKKKKQKKKGDHR